MELLFQLLAGLPDSSEDKKWEGLESDAVKFIYDTLASVFKSSNDESIRVIAIEKELIHKIFDRIGIVSKEVKRKYVKHV
jgi:transcriptional regulator